MRPRRTDLLICVGLVGLILLIYAQTADHAFIQYDDPVYVTDNPVVQKGLTPEGFVWAFRNGAEANYWTPVTWLSHMTDVQLFGLNAGRHHLVSVAFHALDSVVLYLVLLELSGFGVRGSGLGKEEYAAAFSPDTRHPKPETRFPPARWRSALVAALWAVHPLHVESVAWIAERKDVLSALFFLLTVAAYACYAAKPTPLRYALTLLLFVLGMMAKPMLMTLPGVLLLLDYWPLRRLETSRQIRRAVLEKFPLVLLAIACAVVTVIAQRQAGALRTLGQFSVPTRLSNALVSIARYLAKTAFPVDMTPFYPPTTWPWGIVALAALIVVAISVLSLSLARSRRYMIVGWLWFLGMLVPVIGIVQVGRQAMADRYTYLPHIGLFIMISWAACDLASRGKAYRDCIVSVSILAIVALSITAFVQARQWQNTETLFTHALLVSDNNDVAHNQVGNALSRRGDIAGAESHYRQAIRIDPDYALAQMNLGNILVRRRQFAEAVDHFQAALAGTQPEIAKIELGLAVALRGLGRYDESDEMFADVVKREPKLVQAQIGWAESLKDRGRLSEAAAHFRIALQLDPNNALARREMANIPPATLPAPATTQQ